MSKICVKCNIEKPLDAFSNDKSAENKLAFNVKVTQKKTWCKDCCRDYAREWRKNNKAYIGSGKLKNIPEEDRLLLSAISDRLTSAKARAKKHNQPDVEVTREYLYELWKKQNGKCALSGVSLSLEPQTPITLSLDKIEPSKGYVVDNVQWLAWAVNRAKGDMSQTMFINMCSKVISKCYY